MQHVKEVHREQSPESNDKAVLFHITAVAESKTIIYSLQCDEFYSVEKRQYTGRCFELSAGKDYSPADTGHLLISGQKRLDPINTL